MVAKKSPSLKGLPPVLKAIVKSQQDIEGAMLAENIGEAGEAPDKGQ